MDLLTGLTNPAIVPSNDLQQFAGRDGGVLGLILLWEGFLELLVTGQILCCTLRKGMKVEGKGVIKKIVTALG